MSGYPYPIDLNRQPIQIQPMPQQHIMPRPIVPHMASAAAAPQPQQQQQQQPSQPLAMPQHHHMYAAGPSPNIQGYFSSYSARIKQSQENALLLPVSYVTGKKHRLGGDSDDDFEDMLEDSDNDDDSDSNEENTRKTRANAAAVEADAKVLAAMQEQQKKLPKIPHRKNMLYPQTTDLLHMSEASEILVPVRLDIDMDEVKLRDVFLWNMNGNFIRESVLYDMP